MNILQKQVATAKATILVIGGLPSTKIQYFSNWNRIDYFIKDKWDYPVRNTVKLITGNWQLLGFLKDIEEDVAKELVESKETMPMGVLYKDYSTPGWQTSNGITAIKSLHSLIEANCKLKNEYGDYDQALKYFETDKWNKEQSQVFTNPFLLKKV